MHPGSRRRWLLGALALVAATTAWWALRARSDPPSAIPFEAVDPPAGGRRIAPRPDPELAVEALPSPSVEGEERLHEPVAGDPMLATPAEPRPEPRGASALEEEVPQRWRWMFEHGNGLVLYRILSPPGATEARLAFESDDTMTAYEPVSLDEDGDTELGIPLDAGTHAVHLECPCCSERYLVARDVLVTEGRACRPPELNPLVLASYLDSAEVHVVDANGAPFSRVDLHAGSIRGTDRDGVARLLLCRARHALTASSFGYRTVETVLRPGFQEIVMRRGPRVRFRLAEDSLHPENEAAVGATLSLGGKTVGGVLALGEEWTRAMHLSEPATYRVVWSLRAPGATRPTFLADSPLASRSIDVKDVEEFQDFVLRFPEARLREALAELEAELEDGR